MNQMLITANVLVGLTMIALVRFDSAAATPALLMALGVAMLVIAAALEIRTRSLANRMDSRIDERERARRDHAHRIAYWTLAFPAGLIGGYLVSHLQRTWEDGLSLSVSPEAMPEFLVFFWLGLLLFITLPTAIIAWTEPRPLDDDIVRN